MVIFALVGYDKKGESMSRICLTANLNVYVNGPSGSDSTGDGSALLPWATLQHARNTVQRTVDTCGYTVTYDCTGPFTAGLVAQGGLVGQTNPNNELFLFPTGTYIDSGPGCRAFDALYGAKFAVSQPAGALTVRAYGAGGVAFAAADGGFLNVLSQVTIDMSARNGHPCGDYAISTSPFGSIIANSTYIVGDMQSFLFASGGMIQLNPGNTHYVMGNPNYSIGFAWAYDGGTLGVNGQTIIPVGTVAGKRYVAELGGKIATGNQGANYFPGSIAGTTLSGGQYT